MLFCQTGLEAIVPPIMNTIFKFDDSANSYLYLAAALEFIGRQYLIIYQNFKVYAPFCLTRAGAWIDHLFQTM